jgi:threonyl-tRNA synthetase
MANLDKLRHSAAHIMASAVLKLYPKVKIGIGPAIESGFYYDFDNLKVTEEDLLRIEKEAKKIIHQNLPFKKKDINYAEAKKLFKGQKYKLELIEDYKKEGKKLSIYQHGDFMDLCAGPHVKSTGEVKAIKMLKIAGAYWKGTEKNKMLTRIYGTAFANPRDLDKYLKLMEEAERRDNSKLGPKLDLYHINPLIGKGLPLFHPKGTVIRKEVDKLVQEINRELDCVEVFTPHIARSDLWHESGHYKAYKENMFIFEIDGTEFAVKPMNCPFHAQIFKNKHKSYKDLPVRMVETGVVYRNELSGALHGVSRVRCISMDDGHFFITEDQIEQEVTALIKAIVKIWKKYFGMDPTFNLGTRPEKAVGDVKTWKKAEVIMEKILKKLKVKYIVEEGDGAFYGPKVDFNVKDALGREWSIGTVQLDFNLPERFKLYYIDEDNSRKRPIMLHRAMIGSLERCIGMLIEHFEGAF